MVISRTDNYRQLLRGDLQRHEVFYRAMKAADDRSHDLFETRDDAGTTLASFLNIMTAAAMTLPDTIRREMVEWHRSGVELAARTLELLDKMPDDMRDHFESNGALTVEGYVTPPGRMRESEVLSIWSSWLENASPSVKERVFHLSQLVLQRGMCMTIGTTPDGKPHCVPGHINSDD